MSASRHLLVVEAYDGMLEFLSANGEERAGARGLGLPLDQISKRLNCRITVLTWDEWLQYETVPGTFFEWMRFPAARAQAGPGPAPAVTFSDPRVIFRPIPARDPDHGEPLFARPPSPLTYGLLADSDPLFLLSYSLHQYLEKLLTEDPFHAVVVPMWGGLGYTAQMARGTGANRLGDVPFITLATDTSARRHQVNGEGLWTRPAITRRQMEDVSLAFADLALAFGPRGQRLALEGRLPEGGAAVIAPRRIPERTLEHIARAASSRSNAGAIELFLEEPQDPASGVLTALDAVDALRRCGIRFHRPFVSAGPDTRFAPMKPQGFKSYWASRGFVRELISSRCWAWNDRHEAAPGIFSVRLYPSGFEHLPSVWSELGRGGCALLSPAAAEGLAPGARLPAELLLPDEPSVASLTAAMRQLIDLPSARLDELRQDMCASVAAALGGPERERALEGTVEALDRLLHTPPKPQRLDRAARMFLDRTRPLRDIESSQALSTDSRDDAESSLTVVIVCHNMGGLITETVESVWHSYRMPDEVLLVDDGSDDAETLDRLVSLERTSAERGLPLKILRQQNLGLAGARNAGLAAATGKVISFLDGDDLIEPEFYQLALDLARRNPGLGGIAAWALCFGDGVPDGFWNAPQPEFPLLLVENTVIVPCLIRTALLRELGGYDTSQRYNYEDWELSVRLLATGHPIVTIPRYLERYRMRPESLYRTMSEVQNQSMRELMLSHHRETASRFAVEVAMQLEHRLMRRVYAAPVTPVTVEARHLARSARKTLGSLIRRVRGYGKSSPKEAPG